METTELPIQVNVISSGEDGTEAVNENASSEVLDATVAPKKKQKKARKKKALAATVQIEDIPVAEPQALERLDILLSKRNDELLKKLESWMTRQEELILNIDNKIFGDGVSICTSTELGTLPDIEEEAERLDMKGLTKKALQKMHEPSNTLGTMDSNASPQLKMKAAVSAVAKKVKAPPQKMKSKLRNSVEVEGFYDAQRKKEMKKTRLIPNVTPETFRDKVADVITNPIFEMSMMFFCLLSAVVVGIEVNWFASNITATSPPLALTVINHTVSVIFTVELAMKFYVLQLRFFRVDIAWHSLDVLVVSTGLVELTIDLVNLTTCENCSESGLDLGILRALRIARAVRLARLARLVQYIRELRRLIISVMATLKSVFWTIVLLALIIYTFAVIFQQAVNDYEQSLLQGNTTVVSTETEKFFPGLLRTSLTLLQTATGGLSWIEVESALSNISTLLVVVFLCFLQHCDRKRQPGCRGPN